MTTNSDEIKKMIDKLESALRWAEQNAKSNVDLNAGDCFLSLLFLKEMSELYPQKAPPFEEIYAAKDESELGKKISETLADLGEKYFNDPAALTLIDFESPLGFKSPNDKYWHLSKLAERIAKADCFAAGSDSADFADVFERMAEAARKQPGRFRSMGRTADPLAELLASLVAPVDGDRVYDPACGCGTLLAKVRQKVPNGEVLLHGQECDPANLTLCKMNMLLRGIHNATLWLGETLSDPQNINDDELVTFSVVVADPPFGLRHWDRRVFEGKENSGDAWRRFDWGVPMIGDFAFTLHALKCLDAEGGRMAIILPLGALTRGGTDREIRRKFVKNNLLDAVIGLPPKLCGNTAIPVCILVFKTGRTERNVLFIDASNKENYVAGWERNSLRRSDIDKIVDVYQTRKEEKEFSRSVSKSELTGNDCDLKVERYVEAPDEIEDRERLILELKARIARNSAEWPVIKAGIEKYDTELEQL